MRPVNLDRMRRHRPHHDPWVDLGWTTDGENILGRPKREGYIWIGPADAADVDDPTNWLKLGWPKPPARNWKPCCIAGAIGWPEPCPWHSTPREPE